MQDAAAADVLVKRQIHNCLSVCMADNYPPATAHGRYPTSLVIKTSVNPKVLKYVRTSRAQTLMTFTMAVSNAFLSPLKKIP